NAWSMPITAASPSTVRLTAGRSSRSSCLTDTARRMLALSLTGGLTDPAGRRSEKQPRGSDIDHGRSPYHRPRSDPRGRLGRVVGHFYEAARQVTRLVVAGSVIADRPPVSAHGPSPSQGLCARTGFV